MFSLELHEEIIYLVISYRISMQNQSSSIYTMGWKLKIKVCKILKKTVNIHPKNLKYNSSLLQFFICLKKNQISRNKKLTT